MKNFELLSKVIDNYDELKHSLLRAQTFDPDHYGFPPIYYKIMETDATRVNVFVKAFEYYDFMDKVVCEAGVGTLALTKHFLPVVKKAYLIENNPDLRDFIKKEIKASGWEDKVELIFGDAMKIELPEKVDYVVGELMSIFCGNEYQVQIFEHLRKFLKPNGKLLPEYIHNMIQLCRADFDDNIKHYPLNFMRHLPEQISAQHLVNTIDLYREECFDVDVTIPITPILSGKVNAVYMQSFVQVARGCNFTGTDSLMPPTVCKLQEEVVVEAGKEVLLRCQFGYGTDLDRARFIITNM